MGFTAMEKTMIKEIEKKLIVGLEIGTTKVVALVGEILADNTIDIIGIGVCKSIGINKGIINDLKSTTKCIKKVINQAEIMANCKIYSVYLALSNKYIHCQNEIGIIPISHDEITKEDIDNVIHTAKSVRIKNDHQIIHVIPKEYLVDNQKNIKNPIGLSGIRMQAKVHLITCHNNIEKNIIKAVEACGLQVNNLIFSGIASSEAVLTKDERQLGVCVADIGGGTIDIAMYANGSLQHSCVIPYAGNSVTNDISYALNISFLNAENMKIKYGRAIELPSTEIYNKSKIFNRNKITEEKYKQNILIDAIESRYRELLSLIHLEILNFPKQLHKSENNFKLRAGIVLTGGAANMELLKNCAESVFNIPIRIGHPTKINSIINNVLSSHYSTAIGLLKYGEKYYHCYNKQKPSRNILKKWFQYINNWIKTEL